MSTTTGLDSAVSQTMIGSWLGRLGADLERSIKEKRLLSDGTAVADQEPVFGSHALEAADAFFNQARIHVLDGQYARAEELFNKSLRSKEKILGLDHPDLLCVINSLSRLYFEMGNPEKSKIFAQRALSILGQIRLPDQKELQSEFETSEHDVLKEFLAGADRHALAARLRIKGETVDIAINHIFKRLLSHDSKDAVLAVRQGLGR